MTEEWLIRRADQRKQPIMAVLELTPLCNMDCSMCYVKLTESEMRKQKRIWTIGDWMRVAEQMKQEGVFYVLLTGGEPLAYPGFQRIYQALIDRGMLVSVNTNGTLLDEAWADFFARRRPRRINVSLYGAGKETYGTLCGCPEGYEKAVQAVQMLLERRVNVKINFSVTRWNVHEMEQVHAMAEEWKVPVTMDTYMIPARRERTRACDGKVRLDPEAAAEARIWSWKHQLGTEQMAKERQYYMEESKRIMEGEILEECHADCHAGSSSFAVTWDGRMRPCLTLEKITADLKQCRLSEGWKILTEEMSKLAIHARCGNCKYRPLCRTCVACAEAETGDCGKIPEYMCTYTRTCYELLRKAM